MPPLPQLSLNERRLIELIFKNRGVARVDLAQLSGMTGASVTRLISGLSDLELIAEETERSGAQGQPRRLLQLQAQRFLAAGVTFSVTRMNVVLIDLGGSVVATRALDVKSDRPTDIAARAQEAVDQMLVELSKARDALVGIGFALPGNFGTASHLLKAHPFFPTFEDDQAIQAFRSMFNIPCYVENDGTAAALGEYVFGHRSEAADPFFFIHIGHGVGGGAVIGGRPYRGAHGNACLPGVLYPYDQPRPSGEDLLSTLKAAGVPAADFEEIATLPAKADAVIADWVARAGRQLQQAVRTATAFFDPKLIVLGGRIPDDLNRRLVDAILAEPIDGPSRGLPVAPVIASKLGVQAGAVGAACVPLFETFFAGARTDSGSAYLNGRRSST